jgi:hypothetical protein
MYSYEQALTPVEYLNKLIFEQFKTAAVKTNSNLAKLFTQAGNEEGNNISGVMDNNLIAELNRRLA